MSMKRFVSSYDKHHQAYVTNPKYPDSKGTECKYVIEDSIAFGGICTQCSASLESPSELASLIVGGIE